MAAVNSHGILMNSSFPRARQNDLLIQEVLDETLVYDQHTHQAHCLNNSAAIIWKACDGNTSVSALARLVGTDLDNDAAHLLVANALGELERNGLLMPGALPPTPAISRRELIARIGLTALALPLITSIAAPTAAQAQSGNMGSQGPQGLQGLQGPF